MRRLTRNEVRRIAKVAGIKEDDPILFDGRAAALIEAGIEVGVRIYARVHEDHTNAQRSADDA